MPLLPLCFQSFCSLIVQAVAAIAVFVLLFINTWYIGGVFADTLRWNGPLLLVLSLCQALLLSLEKDRPYRLNIFLLSFLAFLLYVGIHALFLSPVPTLAKREWFLVCQAFLLSHFIYSLWDEPIFKRLVLLGLIGIVCLQLGASFYQYYVNAYWLPESLHLPVYSGRSSGTFGSPNHFASLVSLAFFPSFAAFFRGYSLKISRVLVLLGCLVLLWALGLAFSRGAFLGLAMGFFFFPFLISQKRGFVSRYSLFILILGLLCSSLFYCQLTVFQNRLHFALAESVDSTRLAFWKAAFYLFLEHPLLGQGGASFNALFERFRPPGFVHEPIWAHNEYLNTLCDYGLLGFSLAFLPFVLSLGQSFKIIKLKPYWLNIGLFLSLFAYAIHCFFDFNCHIPGLLLTVAFVYAVFLKLQAIGEHPCPRGYSLLAPCFTLGLVYLSWPSYQADSMGQRVGNALREAEIGNHAKPSSATYKAWEQQLLAGLALEPRQEELWFYLSQVYYGLYTLEAETSFKLKSLSSIEKALENRRIYWVYWVHYALGLILNGEVCKALGALQTALNLAPFQWKAWYYYAFCLKIENTRPDKALEAIEQCLHLSPQNALAERLKADIQSQVAVAPTPSS